MYMQLHRMVRVNAVVQYIEATKSEHFQRIEFPSHLLHVYALHVNCHRHQVS